MEETKGDRQFRFLVLLMYCFSQIASKKSGCVPHGWVDCDIIIIFIYSLNIPPFLVVLKPLFLKGRWAPIQD